MFAYLPGGILGHSGSAQGGNAETLRGTPSKALGRTGRTDESLFLLMNASSVAEFKHKTRRREGGTYPLPHLYEHFGLGRLSRLGHDVPWVKA